MVTLARFHRAMRPAVSDGGERQEAEPAVATLMLGVGLDPPECPRLRSVRT